MGSIRLPPRRNAWAGLGDTASPAHPRGHNAVPFTLGSLDHPQHGRGHGTACQDKRAIYAALEFASLCKVSPLLLTPSKVLPASRRRQQWGRGGMQLISHVETGFPQRPPWGSSPQPRFACSAPPATSNCYVLEELLAR